MRNAILDAALTLRAAGISVIPIGRNKQPAIAWKPFQTRVPTEKEIRDWFANPDRGIAVVCGAVSGGLYALDIDDLETGEGFRRTLPDGFPALPWCETPRPGWRLFFRYTEAPLRSEVLATTAEGQEAIALKGEGTLAIIPPTPSICHPAGKPYRWVQGDLHAVPTLNADQVEELLGLARRLNHKPKEVPTPEQHRRVGDIYNQQADVLALLQQHGWRIDHQDGDNVHLTRPGKEKGTSATWHAGLRRLYIFTTNAPPFEAGRAYSPFAVLALLEHGGDFSTAAKALAPRISSSSPLDSGGVEGWLVENGSTFNQLAQADFPPPEWVVEGVIPASGLTLFVAKKSFGKSWAMLELAIHASLGLPVWGFEVPRARRAAYLALEDSPRRLEERRRLAGLPASPDATVYTRWLPRGKGGAEALLALVRQGVELIIIDTLSRWRELEEEMATPNRRTIWQQEHALTGELQQFAQERNVAIVLVHHAGKIRRDDWVDDSAGTGGLTAPADAVVVGRRGRADATATFAVTGRDVPERELALQFVGFRWMLVGDAREVEMSETRRKILAALRELGEASPKEVSEHTGLPHAVVKVQLHRMTRAEQVANRAGRYSALPVTPVTLLPTPDGNTGNSGNSGNGGYTGYTSATTCMNGTHPQDVETDSPAPPVSARALPCDVCGATVLHVPEGQQLRCIGCGSLRDPPPRQTPLAAACWAIQDALRGRMLTKHALLRATGLPASVVEEALQHMLRMGEVEVIAGTYSLMENADEP